MNSFLRGWLWWMKLGLIAVPFGVLWGCSVLWLGYENPAILIVLLAAAFFAMWKIQGMPPRE